MVDTSYLRKISDDFGLWQHVIAGEISRKDGYSLDDNLRALLVAHKLGDSELVSTYFDYIEKSFNHESNMFIEFFDEHRNPINTEHINPSHDTQSMSRFILAYCIRNDIETERAKLLLSKTKGFDFQTEPHLRPIAYEILMTIEDDSQKEYGMKLLEIFGSRFDANTKWFEKKLTYANALIVYAIASFYNHYKLNNSEVKAMLEQSLEILDFESRIGVIPAPPGNREWFQFGDNRKDVYGQQPVDAGFMVLANIKLFKITDDIKYQKKAEDWYKWFIGNNIFQASLVEGSSCADGIDVRGISKNRGAESTIIYLWASIEFDKFKEQI